jgi:peptide/nickel transport system permease protein
MTNLQTVEASVGAPPASRPRAGLGGKIANLARHITGSPRMLVGLVILVVFILAAIFGPWLVRDPNALAGDPLQSPSGSFLLGTTQSGQDVFAQLVVSARGTLIVGFGAGILATVVSLLIGVGGAFVGGISDDVLNLFTNIILVIPALPLVIIISADLKSGGLSTSILVIAVTSWAGGARVLRGLTLSLRSRDYVLAARVSGERRWRIVVVELLPNLSAFILSGFIFSVVFAILTQAGLAFIGLQSPTSQTWGNMLYFAQNAEALSSGAWWWFVPPGLCIALVGTALTLINFGLDEIVNPRLKATAVPRARRRIGRGARDGKEKTA